MTVTRDDLAWFHAVEENRLATFVWRGAMELRQSAGVLSNEAPGYPLNKAVARLHERAAEELEACAHKLRALGFEAPMFKETTPCL